MEIHALLKETLFNSKLLGEFVVFCLALLFQIFEVCTAVGNHFQESAARVMVFLVVLQMRCKLVDLLAQDRNLHFRRTSVSVVALVLSDDDLLFLDC